MLCSGKGHLANKTAKEIAETITNGLKTVQQIIKVWKGRRQLSSLRKTCLGGKKKKKHDHDQRSFKHVGKSN